MKKNTSSAITKHFESNRNNLNLHRPVSLRTKFSVSNVRRNPTVTRFQGGEIQSRFLLGGKKGARVTRGFDKQRSTTNHIHTYIHTYIHTRSQLFSIQWPLLKSNRPHAPRGGWFVDGKAHASASCNVAGAASKWRQSPLFAASWISGSLCSATTSLRRLYEAFLTRFAIPFAGLPIIQRIRTIARVYTNVCNNFEQFSEHLWQFWKFDRYRDEMCVRAMFHWSN